MVVTGFCGLWSRAKPCYWQSVTCGSLEVWRLPAHRPAINSDSAGECGMDGVVCGSRIVPSPVKMPHNSNRNEMTVHGVVTFLLGTTIGIILNVQENFSEKVLLIQFARWGTWGRENFSKFSGDLRHDPGKSGLHMDLSMVSNPEPGSSCPASECPGLWWYLVMSSEHSWDSAVGRMGSWSCWRSRASFSVPSHSHDLCLMFF